MLKLYHAPRSRSLRTLWLLEELAVPYELEVVSIRRGDGSGQSDPVYRAIHPHGKVPALEHDGMFVFETPAIALYLTDLFPERLLGPAVGDPLRGAYLTWLAYSTGVFEPAIMEKVLKIAHPPAAGWAPYEEVLHTVDRTLQARPFLLGDAFSAADVVVGGTVQFMLQAQLLPATPAFTAYAERLAGRPALHRALQREGE